ncbi:phage filamentation protein Fil family protein [Limnobaculum xujianqingii]|uniref:phage filamentation protein Fil family protein n=1 Tax=Limnobaculum xujianqingii TaxID=2738837 RepID=UPI0011275456|nr:phage filamentation protein Fil family protein [Limnobaculum xujianqingii]
MNKCPSLSSMLRHGQEVTHCHHSRGWLETPDGQFFQPKVSNVQFIAGRDKPFMCGNKRRSLWFKLFGINR